jgi:hypothetical protein
VYLGVQLKNKKIIFNIDNQSVVHIINKKSSKSVRVMSLVRHLVLSTLPRDGLVFRCLIGLPLDKGSGNAANHNEIKNQQFYLKFQKYVKL